jgi:hypothetical protein
MESNRTGSVMMFRLGWRFQVQPSRQGGLAEAAVGFAHSLRLGRSRLK